MANDKIKAKKVGLYANMAELGSPTYESAPDWELIACSTSKGFNSDLATIETASDCDDEATSVEPGDITWSFTNDFYAVTNLDAGKISHHTVLSVHKAKEKRQYKLESIEDAGASFYIMGYGLLTNVAITGDTGDYLTGSLTVTGSGDYEDSVGS